MIVDEADHHFGRRSSSAWAKYADALRRISFARFSSRFSRSSSFSRCRSSRRQARPRWPLSRSACRTHSRSVSAVQPSLLGHRRDRRPLRRMLRAMLSDHPDRALADLRANTCSVVPWAPSSQGMSPPTKPGTVHSGESSHVARERNNGSSRQHPLAACFSSMDAGLDRRDRTNARRSMIVHESSTIGGRAHSAGFARQDP